MKSILFKFARESYPTEVSTMEFVSINKERIKYLLSLYKMTVDEFMYIVTKGLKKPFTWEDVYRDRIALNILKRVDSFFQKGLFYYADPATPEKRKSVSVFFRKNTFETELNLGSKQRVREFEDLKTRLNTISKLSEVTLKRKLPTTELSSDPREIAFALREQVLPDFTDNKRDFLKNFINKLGDQNIFVFEFVDVKNKKEKANVDGFYLSPNAIVLRRMQESFSREIFTLAHELGHYLLNQEEIEVVDITKLSHHDVPISAVEKWCNSFAYFLLLGEEKAELLDKITMFTAQNDYGHELVKQISKETNLSRLAIFTNLLIQKKISYNAYMNIKEEMEELWQQRLQRKIFQKEQDKANGIEVQGRNPQPIRAEIVKDVFSVALSSGVIGEQEYCKVMNIEPTEINKFRYQ